jgi:uncharacterized phage protein gp47/JayE
MPGPYPLSTLSVTIDANGISAPTFEDIFASFQAAYQQIYGTDTDLDPDSQDGQWLAVQSQIVYDANQATIAAYLSYSPSFAQGVGLSSVVKINGIRRQAPSNSTVDVVLTGQAGTTINNGIVGDAFNNNWDLPAQVIIPAAGAITVTATAEVAGATLAAPNTVTTMVTMVPGWQSVTNPLSATAGAPVETDAELRMRQTVSTSISAITPRLSILGALENVAGVTRAQVYDNDTDATDVNGVPPHSIACVVEGGDATDIATTILEKKNTGCGTYGTTTIVVVDSMGVSQTIDFFVLQEQQVYVAITLLPLVGYQDSTGQLIIASVVAALNGLGIGQVVYAEWLHPPADLQGDVALAATGLPPATLDHLTLTYVLQTLYIGGAANPTSAANLVVPFTSAAASSTANVTVTVLTEPG